MTETKTTDFSERMREARARLGMSQAELVSRLDALGLHIHQATIYKLENGLRRLLLDEAVIIADVLGIELVNSSAEEWKRRAIEAEAKLAKIAVLAADSAPKAVA